MRRTLLAALPVALLVLAAPAAAKDGRKHTTYRAAIAPVAAEEPTASASRRGRAEDAGEVRGKAVLVDGRKRDRVKLRVRGLDRGTAYTWEIREGGCAGEAVGGFRYRALKLRRGGAKGRGVSRSFTAAAGASYALVVSGPGGDVACGEFERKGGKKEERGGEDVEPDGDEGLDDEDLDELDDDESGGDDDPSGDTPDEDEVEDHGGDEDEDEDV